MWLIIGGSGFIGTNFAKFLIENDCNFKIYDVNRSKYLPKNAKVVIGNIRDKTKLSKAMRGNNIVFHLATVPPSLKLSDQEIYEATP
jgi:nucleoside-diphosphate-sugar epimerase